MQLGRFPRAWGPILMVGLAGSIVGCGSGATDGTAGDNTVQAGIRKFYEKKKREGAAAAAKGGGAVPKGVVPVKKGRFRAMPGS